MVIHLGPDPIREFDAHVYYSEATRKLAEDLRARLLMEFSPEEMRIGPLINRPIGPHPLPMFELNFRREYAERIRRWLANHRGVLTVLVHEVTGDDPRDHTVGATWLGSPLELDFSQLDPPPPPSP